MISGVVALNRPRAPLCGQGRVLYLGILPDQVKVSER
jgi:hypothetical protein